MILEDFFRSRTAMDRFRLPPLGSGVDGFCEWLHGQGYRRKGVRQHVWKVSLFNEYLRRRRVHGYQQVEKSLAERFIRLQLARTGPRSRSWGSPVAAAVHAFLGYLSSRGLPAPVTYTPPPYQKILNEYLDFLSRQRGLAQSTMQAHRRGLIPFLEHLGADAVAKRLGDISAERVQLFWAKDTSARSRCEIQGTQTALRTFFRFCVQRGYLKRDLAEAIPRLRTYKLSGVPRAISEEDTEKVLLSIDRTTPVGRRDFAIIQLLYTYGVRGGQVRALQLQDVEWRQSRIRFRSHKRGKEVVVPMTDQVGEALLEYLRHGRPDAPYQEVFLTAHAPVRPMKSPAAMSLLVGHRMVQVGVSCPKKGSHAFRHGFATRMLQRGQSLKTIADLLGHRNINTTFMYTKVDLPTLRQLPLDWPEEVS
jgi:integrase/recombinase XerD